MTAGNEIRMKVQGMGMATQLGLISIYAYCLLREEKKDKIAPKAELQNTKIKRIFLD